jgi:hypothetical protein
MYSVISGNFLPSGKASRHEDVSPAIRQRIIDYCRQSLNGSSYPAHRFYPDLVIPIMCEIESTQPALELSRT